MRNWAAFTANSMWPHRFFAYSLIDLSVLPYVFLCQFLVYHNRIPYVQYQFFRHWFLQWLHTPVPSRIWCHRPSHTQTHTFTGQGDDTLFFNINKYLRFLFLSKCSDICCICKFESWLVVLSWCLSHFASVFSVLYKGNKHQNKY